MGHFVSATLSQSVTLPGFRARADSRADTRAAPLPGAHGHVRPSWPRSAERRPALAPGLDGHPAALPSPPPRAREESLGIRKGFKSRVSILTS